MLVVYFWAGRTGGMGQRVRREGGGGKGRGKEDGAGGRRRRREVEG